jgi:methyltransferase-like protein/SAM-dependent methyltransferase
VSCGDGTNAIAMAFALPDSEFLGIDRAARPIAKGREMITTLGLKNIQLIESDLMEVTADLGQFDYIIAHGFYSWVPFAVQDKLLAICRERLTHQGVAFVSYNAFPGGHVRKMLREMMLFHVRDYSEPGQKVNQARALVKLLADSQPVKSAYGAFLREELTDVLKYDESHLYHDDLAQINSPVYFYQFFQHAAQHELQFLAEADYYEMQYHIYPPETVEALQQLATTNVILKEQYLDFLKCRRFRQTLLCHRDVELNRTPKPEQLRDFYIASPAHAVSVTPDFSPEVVEEFHGKKGAEVATDYPLAKAALSHLCQIKPQHIRFDELVTASRSLLGREGYTEQKDEELALAQILFDVYATGLLELFPRAPDFVSRVSSHPVASELARQQIRHGDVVTNLQLNSVVIEDRLSQELLSALDGTNDREALLGKLIALVQSGAATFQTDGEPLTDPAKLREVLSVELDKNLDRLTQLALLTA